jgi:hypothetical protein
MFFKINDREGIINPTPSFDDPFAFSCNILATTVGNENWSAEINSVRGYIRIEIRKEDALIETIVLDLDGGQELIGTKQFWKSCYVEENDEPMGYFERFFGVFVFECNYVIVVFDTFTETTTVENHIFSRNSMRACVDDGRFSNVVEHFCGHFTSLEELENLCILVCGSEDESAPFGLLKVFTDKQGRYLFFSFFSVVFCDETDEFQQNLLHFSFQTGFGIVAQDFELRLDELGSWFVFKFSIIIDGKTYQVSFYLNSFEGVSFEHQNDCVILNMYFRTSIQKTIYCEESEDNDFTQNSGPRKARVEIEIPGFLPPEDESNLEESLQMLPRSTASFIRRLIWKNLWE